MIEAALGYAKQGWYVFPCHWPVFDKEGVATCTCDPWRAKKGLKPCRSIGKHPLTYHGFHDASIDLGQIESWWKARPKANIGMPTGIKNDMFVLDVDPDHGGDVTLANLESVHGSLPATRRTRTGSGGEHVIFKHIDGLANLVGEVGQGLDVRTEGGYIVVAPSMHGSGRRYEWANTERMTDAPDWLVQKVIGHGADALPGGGQPGYWGRIAGGVREGERHVMILKLSGLLLGTKRIEPVLGLALVRAFNAQYCKPPLSDSDVDERFSRIIKRQQRHER